MRKHTSLVRVVTPSSPVPMSHLIQLDTVRATDYNGTAGADFRLYYKEQAASLVRTTSTARRTYVASSFRRSAWQNNAFPRAKLARYLRYAVLV